jgi:hypothetical protein
MTTSKIKPDNVNGMETLITKCQSTRLSFEYISPETAEMLLEANDKNYRKIIEACSKRYTDDMETNRWTINTATIAISKSKFLLDGQHRLTAIVKSGVGIWTYVLRDCPDELIEDPNQDKGKNRTATTYMQREGIKNAASAAGAVRCLYRIGMNFSAARTGKTAITDAATLDVVLNMPVLFFDCVNVICSTAAKTSYAPSVFSSFFYLACCKNQDAATHFLSVFVKEQAESSYHPANVLREQVASNRKTITSDNFLAMAFTAFDLSMKNETRKLIRSCHGYTMHKEYKETLAAICDRANKTKSVD